MNAVEKGSQIVKATNISGQNGIKISLKLKSTASNFAPPNQLVNFWYTTLKL